MANDANGIGGGGGGPRKPGLPPPQPQGRGARPTRAPLGAVRPGAAGQAKAAGNGARPAAAANAAKPPPRPAATPHTQVKSDAASSERTQASAKAFAAEQAKDGVDAKDYAAHSSPATANKRGDNFEAELRRVASQPELDPLVLPLPMADPISPQKAAEVLTRLTAVSATSAATVAAQRTASAKSVDADDGGAPAAAAAGATGNPTFTPAMLRYAKNELGLTPRAHRALVAMVSGAAVGQAGGEAAATPTTDAPPIEPPPVQQAAPSTAPDAAPSTNKKGDGPTTIEVAHANGLLTTLPDNDAYNLRYKATMSWTAFSKLVTHDQLKAVLTLALLRQIEIGWQNFVQNQATQLDVVRTQTQIEFDRLGVQLDLLSSVTGLRSAWVQGESRPLRNENANKSTFEDEIGIRLETNAKGSSIRNETIDMADELKARQKAAGPFLGRTSFGNEILDAVPAVRGSASEPERTLPRWTLSTEEQKQFTDAERDKYQDLLRRQRVEEDMDTSSKFGRLVYEADMLQKAAEQTRRASQAERAAGQPATAQRYDALARAYDHRVEDLRRQAVNSGYLGTVHSATRSNRAQFKMAIDRELKDLDKVQEQIKTLQDKKQRTAEEALTLRKLQVYEQDRQFRVGGMHAAVTTIENQQGKPSLGRQVSGSQGIVERTRTLLGEVRRRAMGNTPQDAAEGALNTFLSGMHPQAARANLLSEAYGSVHERAWLQQAEHLAPSAENAARLQALGGALPQQVAQASNALRAPNMQPSDARVHAATIDGWLKQNDARYVEHLPGSDRARMARHVEQRKPWDKATPEHVERLGAERAFWAHHPTLAEPPVAEAGRLRKAMNVLLKPNGPSATEPRVGALPGNDPVLGPLFRFAAGGPQVGDGLHPDARAAHLGNLAADARAWSQGYSDKGFDFASMALAYAGKVQAAAAQMGQSAAHVGEGDPSELAGMIDEARDGFYSALSQEQGAVQGLVQQLMSLLKVG